MTKFSPIKIGVGPVSGQRIILKSFELDKKSSLSKGMMKIFKASIFIPAGGSGSNKYHFISFDISARYKSTALKIASFFGERISAMGGNDFKKFFLKKNRGRLQKESFLFKIKGDSGEMVSSLGRMKGRVNNSIVDRVLSKFGELKSESIVSSYMERAKGMYDKYVELKRIVEEKIDGMEDCKRKRELNEVVLEILKDSVKRLARYSLSYFVKGKNGLEIDERKARGMHLSSHQKKDGERLKDILFEIEEKERLLVEYLEDEEKNRNRIKDIESRIKELEKSLKPSYLALKELEKGYTGLRDRALGQKKRSNFFKRIINKFK